MFINSNNIDAFKTHHNVIESIIEREYYNSTKPWENAAKKVFEGTYCRIYDLSVL